MSAEPSRLLDVTRLVSRIGRGPLSGVDRVERAYLEELLRRSGDLHLLTRTSLGYLWLPAAAGFDLLGWLDGTRTAPEAQLLVTLRNLAIDRASRIGLAAMVRRNMARGSAYLNVGHSNLSANGLRQLGRGGLRITVMIHDTIPHDFPQFGATGAKRRFDRMLHAVADHADLVLCNSHATRDDVMRCCAQYRRAPQTLVAHLGVQAPPVETVTAAQRARPYFVILGTIEPRKNHALLLDVWDALERQFTAGDVPDLLIVGSRGWNNQAVFDRLDRRKGTGRVFEYAGMDDSAVSELLKGARALLMPSHAEGYGFPVAEAAALGVPVVCADLSVYREIVGDYPVYAPVSDMYSWLRTIREQAGDRASPAAKSPLQVPSWKDHFDLVLGGT